MKILHFYHSNDKMLTLYVGVLGRVMGGDAQVSISDSLKHFYRSLHEQKPDIVHLHGCWHIDYAIAARFARRSGARVVLSPHGQLEPWVVRQNYWTEKLPKLLAYQRSVVVKAYTVVVMGRMEEECMERLRWNSRREIVHNALITESLTEEQMGERMLAVYRKVLDSDQWTLMDDETRTAVRALLKAGQTGDGRWLDNEEYESCHNLSATALRQITLYGWQESIAETMAKGMETLGMEHTNIEPQSVACYRPAKMKPNVQLKKDGDNDTERLLAMLRSAHRLTLRRRITVSNIVELSTFLRSSTADERKVKETLKDKNLLRYAGRLMQVCADLTGLEEGFMPVDAIDDWHTRRIENIITRHLKI